MRGETTAATVAPVPLADLLGLHFRDDVQQIMDKLAEGRAHACMAALVQSGVRPAQLFVTFKGRGGKTKVDFLPCDAAERQARDATA